jgi:hypothetical protein
LLLKAVNTAYTTVYGKIADHLRELGYSRGRLGELLRFFEDRKDSLPNLALDPLALLPVGCATLPQAVERLAGGLSAEEFVDLDTRMQNLVQLQYRGFTHLCTSQAGSMRSLGTNMLDEAMAFAAPRLQDQDIVAMYLAQHGEGEESRRLLLSAYDQAAPPGSSLAAASSTEFAMLGVPPSPHEPAFRLLARKAFQGTQLLPAASADDIVFYREETQLQLEQLEQLGSTAREAYEQALARDVHPPHTRTDVAEWQQINTQ